MSFDFPVISADSHITEPPDCYSTYIDSAFRDSAPRMVEDPVRGDVFVVPGMKSTVPMGLVAAAGKPAEELTQEGVKFDALHRSGYDATVRLADQDRDGVAAEILYPTVGMVLCGHPDVDSSGPVSTPTTGGSPNTSPKHRTVCSGADRPRCAAWRKGSPTSRRSSRPACVV